MRGSTAKKTHGTAKNGEKELDSFFVNLIYLIAFYETKLKLNFYGGVL